MTADVKVRKYNWVGTQKILITKLLKLNSTVNIIVVNNNTL